MLVAERLSARMGVRLLARRRPDASHEGNVSIVESIVDWLDGWAVALTVVGIYMARRPSLTWEQYARALFGLALGTLTRTEKEIGRLADYTERVQAVLDEMLAALSHFELRVIQYAALLPQDHIYPLWLSALIERDTSVLVPGTPGVDHPGAAAIADLQTEQLLVQRGETREALSLHRALRHSLLDRLRSEATHESLQQQILDLAQEKGDSLDPPIARVKWFNQQKGFGFLAMQGHRDVFVHISAVERAGYTTLVENEWLFCEQAMDMGKSSAVNLVKLVSD